MSGHVNIQVTVEVSTNKWRFSSQDLPVNVSTGAMILPEISPITINYILNQSGEEDIQFCFVNLNDKRAITAQIENISISENKISITDKNSLGATNRTPFGLILYARLFDDISFSQLLKSPDPEVTNDPPSECP